MLSEQKSVPESSRVLDQPWLEWKARRLAREALATKWAEPQRENLQNITNACPFCEDAWEHGGDCSKCCVPRRLCAESGYGGVMGALYTRYGDTLVAKLPSMEFALIRACLQALANGQGESGVEKILVAPYYQDTVARISS